MLWRKIKQVFSILILHQVSAYGPCWRPITDAVSLLWRLKNIHSSVTLQTQLHHEHLPYTARVWWENRRWWRLFTRKQLSAFLAMSWAVNRDKKVQKLQTWTLAQWFSKFFHKLDVVHKMDRANPSVSNSHSVVEWRGVPPGVKHLIDP